MSDGEGAEMAKTETRLLDYKDGQLEIVEVTPFDKVTKETHIVPDAIESEGEDSQKYIQVMSDVSDKGIVQLDLLNLTLVRCEDGEESYRLVANGETDGSTDITSDATVTCVLQSSDGEEHDNQESYVMMEGEHGPLVFLQSSLQQANLPAARTEKTDAKSTALTPQEILEKAKALQKVKALMNQSQVTRGKRGRKRKGDLPPPHELLSSPNFKLFLYSCKMCSYKCNAVKELTAHRAEEHGTGKYRGGSGGGSGRSTAQCAKCPFRTISHTLLVKHDQEVHPEESSNNNKISLNTKEVDAADVLVCGACGFESSSRHTFRRHIEREHGATVSV